MADLEKYITELLEILSCGDAEPDEIKEMLPALTTALKDPRAYFEDFPDDAWLAEGYNLDELDIRLNESIFAWRLSAELENFAVVNDKGDEIFEGVLDVLYDMEIEIEQPKEQYDTWFQFADYLEKELVNKKTGKMVVGLDINFSDSISVFVIERDKWDRLKLLLDYFNLNLIEG